MKLYSEMSDEELKKALSDLPDGQLAVVKNIVSGLVEDRRAKPTLDSIRPGMSKDEEAAAISEIRRVRGNG